MSKRSLLIGIPWLTILLLTSDNFFFWDTIQLASKQAQFFFDSNFSQFFLPNEINSGHPPLYGIALAGFWKIVGKSLFSSHMFNLLFIIGYIYQSHQLGKKLVGEDNAFWFPLILFCNPIFLGHSILVSPDNALIFLFFLAINGILSGKKWMLICASIFLSILSMRGMMTVLALFLSEQIWLYLKEKKIHFRKIFAYFPAAFAAASFLLAHYLHNRWLGFHSDSPWQESFNLVSVNEYFRNLMIIGWRLMDFGNVAMVFGALTLLYFHRKQWRRYSFYMAFAIGFGIVFILPLAGFKFLTAHRYFMPIYAIISFAFVNLIIDSGKQNLGKFALIFLLLGNLWIYPRSISQGWDVTLAHVPFYNLVEQMNDYIRDEELSPDSIGTEFPLKSEPQFLYLSNTKPHFREATIGEKDFILYSRVINDYKIEDYHKLQADYTMRKEFKFFLIDLKLYEKRSKTEARGAE